jgi:hypothetical protein
LPCSPTICHDGSLLPSPCCIIGRLGDLRAVRVSAWQAHRAQEALAFAAAFALSLALSVAVVELIWALLESPR